MEFTRYLRLIIQKWWFVLLFLVAMLGASYYYTQNQPVYYTATATLILNPSVSNPLVPYLNSANSYASNLADNYNLIIKSDKFGVKVIEKLNLPISLKELKNSITTRLAPNTLFYYISATSTDPAKAQRIANTVSKIFLEEGIAQTNTPKNPNDILAITVEKQREALKSLQAEIDNLNEQIRVLQFNATDPKVAEQIKILRLQVREATDIQSRIILAITEVEGKQDASLNKDSASLVDEAKLPASPNENNLIRNLIFGALIGIVLAVAIIILLDYLDYTVRTPDELNQLTGYNTLGIVPYIKTGQWRGSDLAEFAADGAEAPMTLNPALVDRSRLQPLLITANEFQSPASEAYRALRTNVLFAGLDDSDPDVPLESGSGNLLMRTVLVTSTYSEEGKSLTAANLAVAFAQADNKVILVDTDLRKPTLHNLFGHTNDIGFTNLVLGTVSDPMMAIKRTSIRKLFLVTAGTLPPNPSELLTSKRTTKIIERLRRTADIVIFDSPPSSLVTDAHVLATKVDQVVVLVAWKRTRRDSILKTINGLKKVNAKIAGTVLNGVKERRRGGYYYYSGYYSSNGKRDKKSKSVTKTPTVQGSKR